VVARAILRATRPRQWLKNVLVAAAPAAAGVLTEDEPFRAVVGAFVALTLVAAGTYLVNDVVDAEEDRAHPHKRERPVASGALSVRVALAAGAALAVAGAVVAASVSLGLLGVVAAYVALTLAYSARLRAVALADLAAVAALFVLRVLAGGVATGVPVSRWLLAVTTFGAVFVVAGKRYGERRVCGDAAAPVRLALRRYPARLLGWIAVLAAIGAAVAYVFWSLNVAEPAGPSAWYELSAVPFVAFLGRYATIAARGGGGAPEDVLLGDPLLLALVGAWLVAFGCGAYVGG
jgi:decaprenyl-phosphate phosphoribosyltransferase